jgi:hypothetical protein
MAKKKSNGTSPADYEVGRGKPPVHTQFKPGQSGNPGGRKKGSKNFATTLMEVANTEITITDNGSERVVTYLEGIFRRVAHKALLGDLKASTTFLGFSERHLNGANDDGPEDMPEDDCEILQRFFEHQAGLLLKRQRHRGGGDE